jgi:hypothetical protein
MWWCIPTCVTIRIHRLLSCGGYLHGFESVSLWSGLIRHQGIEALGSVVGVTIPNNGQFVWLSLWQARDSTYTWAISWAMMNALVRPSSLLRVQLLVGSQAPDTGAYPDGPPISARVSHTATSCCPPSCSFQRFTFSSERFEFPATTWKNEHMAWHMWYCGMSPALCSYQSVCTPMIFLTLCDSLQIWTGSVVQRSEFRDTNPEALGSIPGLLAFWQVAGLVRITGATKIKISGPGLENRD